MKYLLSLMLLFALVGLVTPVFADIDEFAEVEALEFDDNEWEPESAVFDATSFGEDNAFLDGQETEVASMDGSSFDFGQTEHKVKIPTCSRRKFFIGLLIKLLKKLKAQELEELKSCRPCKDKAKDEHDGCDRHEDKREKSDLKLIKSILALVDKLTRLQFRNELIERRVIKKIIKLIVDLIKFIITNFCQTPTTCPPIVLLAIDKLKLLIRLILAAFADGCGCHHKRFKLVKLIIKIIKDLIALAEAAGGLTAAAFPAPTSAPSAFPAAAFPAVFPASAASLSVTTPLEIVIAVLRVILALVKKLVFLRNIHLHREAALFRELVSQLRIVLMREEPKRKDDCGCGHNSEANAVIPEVALQLPCLAFRVGCLKGFEVCVGSKFTHDSGKGTSQFDSQGTTGQYDSQLVDSDDGEEEFEGDN